MTREMDAGPRPNIWQAMSDGAYGFNGLFAICATLFLVSEMVIQTGILSVYFLKPKVFHDNPIPAYCTVRAVARCATIILCLRSFFSLVKLRPNAVRLFVFVIIWTLIEGYVVLFVAPDIRYGFDEFFTTS